MDQSDFVISPIHDPESEIDNILNHKLEEIKKDFDDYFQKRTKDDRMDIRKKYILYTILMLLVSSVVFIALYLVYNQSRAIISIYFVFIEVLLIIIMSAVPPEQYNIASNLVKRKLCFCEIDEPCNHFCQCSCCPSHMQTRAYYFFFIISAIGFGTNLWSFVVYGIDSNLSFRTRWLSYTEFIPGIIIGIYFLCRFLVFTFRGTLIDYDSLHQLIRISCLQFAYVSMILFLIDDDYCCFDSNMGLYDIFIAVLASTLFLFIIFYYFFQLRLCNRTGKPKEEDETEVIYQRRKKETENTKDIYQILWLIFGATCISSLINGVGIVITGRAFKDEYISLNDQIILYFTLFGVLFIISVVYWTAKTVFNLPSFFLTWIVDIYNLRNDGAKMTDLILVSRTAIWPKYDKKYVYWIERKEPVFTDINDNMRVNKWIKCDLSTESLSKLSDKSNDCDATENMSYLTAEVDYNGDKATIFLKHTFEKTTLLLQNQNDRRNSTDSTIDSTSKRLSLSKAERYNLKSFNSNFESPTTTTNSINDSKLTIQIPVKCYNPFSIASTPTTVSIRYLDLHKFKLINDKYWFTDADMEPTKSKNNNIYMNHTELLSANQSIFTYFWSIDVFISHNWLRLDEITKANILAASATATTTAPAAGINETVTPADNDSKIEVIMTEPMKIKTRRFLGYLKSEYKSKLRKYPKIWLDQVCLDQSKTPTNDKSDSIARLPLILAQCKSALILFNKIYLYKWWCIWEVYCMFAFCDSSLAYQRIKVLYVEKSIDLQIIVRDFIEKQLTNEPMLSGVFCFDPNEEYRFRYLFFEIITVDRLRYVLKQFAKLPEENIIMPAYFYERKVKIEAAVASNKTEKSNENNV